MLVKGREDKQSLVVKANGEVTGFQKLVNRQCRVVRFDYRFGYLRTVMIQQLLKGKSIYRRSRQDRKSSHHSVWIFLPKLSHHQSAQTCASPTTQRMQELEALQCITAFSLSTDDVLENETIRANMGTDGSTDEDGISKLGSYI